MIYDLIILIIKNSNRSFALGVISLLTFLLLTMYYLDMYPSLPTLRPASMTSHNDVELLRHRHLAENEILESSQFVSYDSILQDNFSFNINGSDVMVFLHIQKTGENTLECQFLRESIWPWIHKWDLNTRHPKFR